MMMYKTKYQLLLFVLLLPSLSVFGQFRLGVRAGINKPQIRFIEDNYKAKPESLLSPQIGMIGELNITDMFFAQSGIYFQQVGGAFTLPQQTVDNINIKTRVSLVQIPIEAGIRYYWKENTSIIGTLGVFGAYGIFAREKSGNVKQKIPFDENAEYALNPYTFGLSTSLGLEFQNTIQVKAHYMYGFTRVYNLSNTVSNHNGLSLTLAYLFGN